MFTPEILLKHIHGLARTLPTVTIMEVCGTHTHNIHRFGLRQLLPANIRLISGPGCPVCVTAASDIAQAIDIAAKKNTILCCFGDMMRVPCGDKNLATLQDEGSDIRYVLSPLDTIAIAQENPDKEVIWFGVGFETTAPHSAVLAESILKKGIDNLSILSAHKTMPSAISALLKNATHIDALLCPGHVASITGSEMFRFIPEQLNLPAAISGFEATDILLAIVYILKMIHSGSADCINAYPTAVTSSGNSKAQHYLSHYFESNDCQWRGLGIIPNSGLVLKHEYNGIDAQKRFSLPAHCVTEPAGCLCSEILCGKQEPLDCPHFATTCTPHTPLGACMVSSEGTCAAFFKYGG